MMSSTSEAQLDEHSRMTRFIAVTSGVLIDDSFLRSKSTLSEIERAIKKIDLQEINGLKRRFESVKTDNDYFLRLSSDCRWYKFLTESIICSKFSSDYKLECERTSKYIKNGFFKDEELLSLNIELLIDSTYGNSRLDAKSLMSEIHEFNRNYIKRLSNSSEVKWINKKDGEDLNLKLQCANNVLSAYFGKFNYIDHPNIEGILSDLDVAEIREKKAYELFDKITTSYRSQKSKKRAGVVQLSCKITKDSDDLLSRLASQFKLSKQEVVQVILNNHKALGIEKYIGDFFQKKHQLTGMD